MKLATVNAWRRRLFRTARRILTGREPLANDMEEELRVHLEMKAEANERAGMSPTDARRAATQRFGWNENVKEDCRDVRGIRWMEDLAHDLVIGARMLRKNLGFAMAAIALLALGIGGCTAIFSLIDALLIRALPFPNDDRLVVIWADNISRRQLSPVFPPSNADVAQLRRQTANFQSVAAFSSRTADMTDGGDPERIGAAGVTAGFFETLGIAPLLGRTIAADEEVPEAAPVALIGYELWQRRFGGDQSILGKGITINGRKHTLIGILPPDFDFPRGSEWPSFYPFSGRSEVWLPLGFRAQDDGSGWSNWASRDERGLIAVGRLKPGTTQQAAQAEMDAYAARQAEEHPDSHKGWAFKLVSLRTQVAGKFRNELFILFAAVVLLLIIACANVANLILARSLSRQQEMAVRASLGAGRSRLVRQILAECALLAGIGCGCGLLVGRAFVRVFLSFNPVTISRLDDASTNWIVVGFATIVALASSAIFGLAPALQAWRFDLRATLQEGGRAFGATIRERARGWLVASEVALALTLLTTAGLMIRSFQRVQAVDLGFQSESVLAFDVQLGGAGYNSEASQIRFFKELTERLAALPGARAAGAISYLPLAGGQNTGRFTIDGNTPTRPGEEPNAERRWITPGYFNAMRIPLREGRAFTEADTADQPRVAIINQTMARQFFNGKTPLGARVNVGGASRTIIGVVADVKSASIESETRPQVYIPNAQWAWGGMTVVVRTDANPLMFAGAARAELKALDPLLPAANVRTMKQVASKAAGARRYNMALLTFFAAVALALTVIGIYSVTMFLVGRRVREIGVRMALGAQRKDVLRLILAQGFKPVILGSIVGLGGSFAASRLVTSQLYGVSPLDPVTIGVIVALLMGAAAVACWIPARKAAQIDPMMALRH